MKLRGLYVSSTIIMVCAAIIAIVLLALTLRSYDYEFSMYDDMKKNMIQNPISKIYVQTSPCLNPATSLFGLQWPGIQSYCSCWLYSTAGACSYKQQRGGCTTKGNIPAAPLNKYKGVYICADKLNFDYDTLKEERPDGSCKTGTVQCGTSTGGWRLCFPEGTICPVNDIIFSAVKRPDLGINGYQELAITYPAVNGAVLNFNNDIINKQNWYIYYTNTQIDKPVVVQFATGFQKNICFHPAQKLTPKEQYKYLKDIDSYKTQCDSISNQLYDTRYSYLDTYNQYNLWIENGMLPVMESLRDFDGQSLNYEFDVFKRGYIHLDEACQFDGTNKVYQLKSQILDMLSFRYIEYNKKAYFITCFVTLGFAIFFGLIAICTTCDSKATTWCQWIFGLIVACLVITAFVLAIIMYIRGRDRTAQVERIYPLKCGDDLTNIAIDASYHNSHREAIYFLAVIVVLGLGILLFLIYSLLKPCEKKPKHQAVPHINTDERHQPDNLTANIDTYHPFDMEQDQPLVY